MNSGSDTPSPSTPLPPIRRRPGRLRLVVLVLAVGLVATIAGIGVYVALSSAGPTTLVIYTYPSLLGGNCGGNTTTALQPFASAHDVRIELDCEYPNLASALIAQKGSPGADLVIGLDEITAPQADAAGVLVPYTPPELANVSPTLVNELAPDHAATPYEWGYLGVDSCASFANATGGAVDQFQFPQFATNATWAKNLIVEDPTTDITGEEFLLWEIEYYTEVLHQNWTSWWSAVAPGMTTADNWGDAFDEFTCAPGTPGVVVSYLNDPAYAAWAGTPGAFNSSVSWSNGTAYGWKTVYGIGIVAGSRHLTLDEEFVDWFLSGGLQSELPTTEWEYPANATIPVPAAYYGYAMNSSRVVALNADITGPEIVAGLDGSDGHGGWLDQWQAVVDAAD
jgi:thiamine transport system substrate-binding protein